MKKKIGIFIASISPGLFLIGYNIGTGSITTMASAGASYGMELILPVLLSCIFTYFLIIIFGQYTIVTGDTILHSYRKHFGTFASAIVLVSLLVSEWVACMGVMGVIVQVVQEWSKPLTSSGEGFSPILVTAVFGSIIYWIFWQGKHRFFERVLVVFVAIMGFCFIATMFMVAPDTETILKGLIPKIPGDKSEMLLLAGMVGTTMGGVLYVVRSILVHEKKWSLKDIKLEKRDAAISASLMFILSFAIMAAAAGTLHVNNLRIDNAIDMVNLLEPLMGRFSVSIFVVGIVCAGLSSLFPIVLLGPWLIADFRNTKRDLSTTSSKLLVLFGVLLGFVVPIFGGRPVFVMIVSQAAASIVTPLILILMMILINKEAVMGKFAAKLPRNILLTFIILFTIAIAISGIFGIF